MAKTAGIIWIFVSLAFMLVGLHFAQRWFSSVN